MFEALFKIFCDCKRASEVQSKGDALTSLMVSMCEGGLRKMGTGFLARLVATGQEVMVLN